MDGIDVIRLPAFDIFYLPMITGIPRDLLAGFDLIHSHGPAFNLTARAIKFGQLPHVVTFHCDTTISGRFWNIPIPRWFTVLFENLINRYVQKQLPCVNAIITTTRSYAETSPVVSRLAFRPIPIGIDTKPWDDALASLSPEEKKRDPHRILFVGRLAANKGLEILIDALVKVKKTLPKANLIISGEGEEKLRVVAQVKKENLADSVTFLGKMSFKELVQLYATPAVFVLPSINRLEAYGIVQLEAMTCGTPVIASNIPGVNGVMEEGKSGYLFPNGDSDTLAEKLMRILGKPDRIDQMGRAGRTLIETKYGWKTIVDEIERVYRGAIEKFRPVR